MSFTDVGVFDAQFPAALGARAGDKVVLCTL